ncbi:MULTISPECIES: Sec-independent protein translocase protein TatB [unclassified Thermomonas]|uniref:Sec-independent protein translocase protein TatB n=1 Tax=unclassified Thermomonas TaxID=2633315 RepID=UPI001680BB72|nr:Sec-independent protein translocase protein TatB [Thermomonas sp. XSG]QNU15167.1 twin-arginine translocase subunit TatB [Thermomonas sp. XSG]
MFEVSFPELVILGAIALLVLGPERLPKAARFVGLWVRKARAQWFAMKNELEQELAHEELRRSLQETRQALQEVQQGVQLDTPMQDAPPPSTPPPPATRQGHDGT